MNSPLFDRFLGGSVREDSEEFLGASSWNRIRQRSARASLCTTFVGPVDEGCQVRRRLELVTESDLRGVGDLQIATG